MYTFIKSSYALLFLHFNFVNSEKITIRKIQKKNMGQLQN